MLAQELSRGLGQLCEECPADVATVQTLAGVEALRALALHSAESAAAKAFDGVFLGHARFVGPRQGLDAPSKGGGSLGDLVGGLGETSAERRSAKPS